MKSPILRSSFGSRTASGLNVPLLPSPRGIDVGDLAGKILDLELGDARAGTAAGKQLLASYARRPLRTARADPGR